MKPITFILFTALLCSCSSNSNDHTTVCGRVYPERQDDLCWENEYVGFRAYGPSTQANDEKMYGYDLFLKRGTTEPIIDELIATDHNPLSWAKVDSLRLLGEDSKADSLIESFSYHVDHGYGMDCYAVGPTLGAGVTAIVDSLGQIIYPWCYKEAEIIENGPKRFKARLTFEPYVYDGDTITEVRIITLDSRTNLNHTSVTYLGLTKPVKIITGIVLHDQSPVTIDPNQRYMAYTDPTQGDNNGQLYLGAVFPVRADSINVYEQNGVRHLSAFNTYTPDAPFEYLWGFGWNRGNVPSLDHWIKILSNDNR